MRLPGVPRQQCAENQIGDNGFQQGAGRLLVASRHAEVVGDHNTGGQYQPKPKPGHHRASRPAPLWLVCLALIPLSSVDNPDKGITLPMRLDGESQFGILATQKAFPPHLLLETDSRSNAKGIIVGGHDRQP